MALPDPAAEGFLARLGESAPVGYGAASIGEPSEIGMVGAAYCLVRPMFLHYPWVSEAVRFDASGVQRQQEVHLRRCEAVFSELVRATDRDETAKLGRQESELVHCLSAWCGSCGGHA